MKQILQNISNGETQLVDVPSPNCSDGSVLIETSKTLVSSGTERMLMDFGKANYLQKARQQPDKVKQVLDKIKTDGFLPTIEAVRSKLDQPIPLGYSNVGVVIESGDKSFKIDDRVISNGCHAETVVVPKNLCCRIPHNVDDETAAFTVIGSVGLQGIRLINPTLGESIAVFGLGLIGLITIQMLKANGCHVIGIDTNAERCKIANGFGVPTVDLSSNQDLESYTKSFTNNIGVDGVIITASSSSNDIIHHAAKITRKRGRIVLVGVVGLDLKRDDFYEKELTFQVSASYGPGRYDPNYEARGNDYPIGFVRWTQQRNFQAVLEMMSNNLIDVKPLISESYDIDNALEGYKKLEDKSTLGVLINYPSSTTSREKTVVFSESKPTRRKNQKPIVGFIGAGNYASRVLIPSFKKSGCNLETLVSNEGLSGFVSANKYGFSKTTTDINKVWQDNNVNCVAIATRHRLHAEQIISAINSSKHVYVEKPLALTLDEIKQIDSAYRDHLENKENYLNLMIGFNRRFAPLVKKMKSLLNDVLSPKAIVITVNAGHIDMDHWTQDLLEGGGRVVGEACHFVDLARFITGSKIVSYHASSLGEINSRKHPADIATLNLNFEDGSIATIHYFSNGGNLFPKERVEVFFEDSVLQLNNYRSLKGYGIKGFKEQKSFKQDKGHDNCVNSFLNSVESGFESPIPYDEIIEVSKVTLGLADKLKT